MPNKSQKDKKKSMITNNLLQVGIFLLFLGMIVIIIASLTTTKTNANVKAAGGIFIGPFPLFGFASDKKMFYLLIAVAVFITIIYLVFSKLT